MRGRSRLIAAVATLALLMTGCFQLGWMKLSKRVVDNKEKLVLNLGMYPFSFEGTKDYPFVLLMLPPNSEGFKVNVAQPKVFDVNKKFGNNSRELVSDPTLASVATSDGLACDEFHGFHISTPKVVALRTASPLNDKGQPGKQALTKIGLKPVGSADPYGGTVFPIQVFVGGWDDTEGTTPGVPDDEDSIACNSDASTWINVRPDPDAEPVSIKAEVKREIERRS